MNKLIASGLSQYDSFVILVWMTADVSAIFFVDLSDVRWLIQKSTSSSLRFLPECCLSRDSTIREKYNSSWSFSTLYISFYYFIIIHSCRKIRSGHSSVLKIIILLSSVFPSVNTDWYTLVRLSRTGFSCLAANAIFCFVMMGISNWYWAVRPFIIVVVLVHRFLKLLSSDIARTAFRSKLIQAVLIRNLRAPRNREVEGLN